MWFDKVCLNKLDANDKGITLLPITVGACRKVVILLSPTYLTRLWCVWELHAVFAFCIRELALDRVIVVDAGGGDALKCTALSWTIDDAHCFDPNEELRLRRLAEVIGFERFAACVRDLATCDVLKFPAA